MGEGTGLWARGGAVGEGQGCGRGDGAGLSRWVTEREEEGKLRSALPVAALLAVGPVSLGAYLSLGEVCTILLPRLNGMSPQFYSEGCSQGA